MTYLDELRIADVDTVIESQWWDFSIKSSSGKSLNTRSTTQGSFP
jgi:hypothetical protein